MLGFFIKKNFFDSWDSLFKLVIYNIPFAFFAAGAFAGFCFIPSIKLAYTVLTLAVILICVYFCALSGMTYKITCNKNATFADFKASLAKHWKTGLSLGVIWVGILALMFFVIPFYLQKGNYENSLISACFFWLLMVFLFAFQWAIPCCVQLGNPLAKAIKKGFILFLDNPGVTIFLFLHSLFRIALSAFFLLLYPSLAGLALSQNEAFRLLLYKYDWLEEKEKEYANRLNSGEENTQEMIHSYAAKTLRKQIPWETLLAQDKETLGTRSLKNFIFPWKN